MPNLNIDRETADLLTASAEMLLAALVARSKRIDPERLLSASAELQAYKMETVLHQLAQGDPPPWSGLDKSVRNAILTLAEALVVAPTAEKADDTYRQLMDLANAAALPSTPSPRHDRLSQIQNAHDAATAAVRMVQSRAKPRARS